MENSNTENSNVMGSRGSAILKHPYLKIIVVVILMLIMTIPNLFLRDLIREREYRRTDVISEVTKKWSDGQTIAGPVLVLPFTRTESSIDITTKKPTQHVYRSTYFILPEKFKLDGDVGAESLHRGIYNVPVYKSDVAIEANFKIPEEIRNIENVELLFEKAYVAIAISDMGGLEKIPDVSLAGNSLEVESATAYPKLLGSHLRTKEGALKETEMEFNLTAKLALKGSNYMYFKPFGKYSEVNLKGNWASPSFDGDFLPSERNVEEDSFSANWSVLSHNRTYPQYWTTSEDYRTDEKFGVNFIIPVDHYQKTDRSIKYSMLIIALSFIALYFIELITKKPISIVSYGLIAAALIVYYTLILSIGEHTGFNMAYLIASFATIGLITLFAKGLLVKWKPTLSLAFILSAFYTFIFVTLKQEDYALLVGSVGLFVVLAIIMFASQRIKKLI